MLPVVHCSIPAKLDHSVQLFSITLLNPHGYPPYSPAGHLLDVVVVHWLIPYILAIIVPNST